MSKPKDGFRDSYPNAGRDHWNEGNQYGSAPAPKTAPAKPMPKTMPKEKGE